MGRKSLAPGEETEILGVKLPASVVRELIAIGRTMDEKKSTVGRRFLLLGKAVYDSCLAMGIKLELDELSEHNAEEKVGHVLINKASSS